MKVDFEGIFAEGVGFLVKQLFFFIAAVWGGCGLAALAMIAGEATKGFFHVGDLNILLISPALLLTAWILPNIIFLGITCCRLMIYSESTGLRTWACLIGVEALFSMAPVYHEFDEEPLAMAVAWVTVLVLIAMVSAAFWYWNAWRMNRFATDLIHLQIENTERRKELKEEYGTESSGAESL